MKTYLTILLILTLSTPAVAVSGYVEVEGGSQNYGRIHLEKGFDGFDIGIFGETKLAGFGRRGIIPTGIPVWQYYEGFVRVNITDELSVKLSSYCKHYLSQSGRMDDYGGLSASIRYEWGD